MIAEGEAVALVSDAGTPMISDPGYKLVRQIIAEGHEVTALRVRMPFCQRCNYPHCHAMRLASSGFYLRGPVRVKHCSRNGWIVRAHSFVTKPHRDWKTR